MVFLGIGLCMFSLNASSEPIDIGSRLELMVDDYIIDQIIGDADRILHHPTPQDIVIVMDRSWEGASCAYMTVFKDGDVYRMYYRGSHVVYTQDNIKAPHPEYTCYAESRDGINWTKPNLRIYEIDGTLDNNVVLASQVNERETHNFCPFIDTKPGIPSSEKYKAVGGISGGLYAFVSEDAIHWRKLREETVITKGDFDSQNLAFWDTEKGEYRAYFRAFRNGRDIKTCTSQDFINWTEPTFLEYSPNRVSELYTNQINPYYRAQHILLGFPTRYTDRGWTEAAKYLPQYDYREVRASRSVREGTAVTDGMFMTSRDRLHFNVYPESFIRPGLRTKDGWFYGDNYHNLGLVETKSKIDDALDELSIYVSEGSMQGEGTNWRRHTIRIDGFVSIYAKLGGGEIITRPIVFNGKELLINYSTSAVGGLKTEIQNADGEAIEGYSMSDSEELYGDSLAQPVLWKDGSDVSKLSGKPIRLRFMLKDADLYSFRFQP